MNSYKSNQQFATILDFFLSFFFPQRQFGHDWTREGTYTSSSETLVQTSDLVQFLKWPLKINVVDCKGDMHMILFGYVISENLCCISFLGPN